MQNLVSLTRCRSQSAKSALKYFSSRGSVPDPTGGARSIPPYPIAGLKGACF